MMLVIYVDRDDDLGRKAGVAGPIIGREKAREAAIKLIEADPRDTDANSLFFALKLLNELKDAEIVVLTGSANVGIESDEKIRKQLEEVLKKIKAREAIFVSNGEEDEEVLPIIQSKLKIASVYRFGIKESGKLKGIVYAIKDFLDRVRSDFKQSLLFLGLPGLVLFFFALFGSIAWRVLLAFIGLWLIYLGIGEHIGNIKPSYSWVIYFIALLSLLSGIRAIYLKKSFTDILNLFFLSFFLASGAYFMNNLRKLVLAWVSLISAYLASRAFLSWILLPTYELTYMLFTFGLLFIVVFFVRKIL